MPTEILMPALSPTMEEGTLAKWLVQQGDRVSAGDLLAEIETDKATMEFEAVEDGTIGKLLVAAGTAGVKVNRPIAVLLAEGESAIGSAQKASEAAAEIPRGQDRPENPGPLASRPPAAVAPATGAARVFASPLARRIAKDKGLDLGQITGSGPRGRIIRADVEKAGTQPAKQDLTHPAPQPVSSAPSPVSGDIASLYLGREYEEIPLDGMRKTVAARLTEAKQTIPHFYLRRNITLDALLKLRSDMNGQLAARGIKISINDFIIKACAIALQQVPEANAVWAGDRIFRLKPSDVAVAVAIDGGLFTPVLRDAEKKSLSSLSAEMKDLADRARARKLAPHEYQGGSFAISNLGMFGIDNFDAVINPPQGAILAVGAGVKKPIIGEDGEIGAATVMSVTLSVDHRAIDGALAARFLGAIKSGLEQPLALLA